MKNGLWLLVLNAVIHYEKIFLSTDSSFENFLGDFSALEHAQACKIRMKASFLKLNKMTETYLDFEILQSS